MSCHVPLQDVFSWRSAGRVRDRSAVARRLADAGEDGVWHERGRKAYVAFHRRAEGRVCDPRSRACVRLLEQERWVEAQRTGTDGGDGRVLESGDCGLYSSSGAPGVESVVNPPLRSRAGALATVR